MAEPYLSELRAIIERFAQRHGDKSELTCKHFFSGAAGYMGGKIFITFTPAGLALKLSESDLNAAFAKGAKSLKYFPKSPIKKDYAVMPAHLTEDDANLAEWIKRSMGFVKA